MYFRLTKNCSVATDCPDQQLPVILPVRMPYISYANKLIAVTAEYMINKQVLLQ